MNRTPRSANRRASRQLAAKDPSPGLQPYRSKTCWGSWLESIRSGTLDCIWNAISYCVIRVAISGSSTTASYCALIALTACTTSCCWSRDTPAGLLRYSTGSPRPRKATPWNRLGKNPDDHCRAAMGWFCPPRPRDVSTTKPGRSSASLPKPYTAQAPIAGRPAICEPVFMNMCAGSWLMASVVIDRTKQISPATAAVCSNSSQISTPVSNFLNFSCGPKQTSLAP